MAYPFTKIGDENSAYIRPDKAVKDMNAKELMQLFAWYEFRDPIDQDIVYCTDFAELVERATGEPYPYGGLTPAAAWGMGGGDYPSTVSSLSNGRFVFSESTLPSAQAGVNSGSKVPKTVRRLNDRLIEVRCGRRSQPWSPFLFWLNGAPKRLTFHGVCHV